MILLLTMQDSPPEFILLFGGGAGIWFQASWLHMQNSKPPNQPDQTG